jgi:hypothetical protein
MAGQSPNKNSFGTTSLVLGIVMVVLGGLPLVWIAGVVGIVTGVRGLNMAKSGEATNKTVAIWGLSLSIAGTVLWGLTKFAAGYNS